LEAKAPRVKKLKIFIFLSSWFSSLFKKEAVRLFRVLNLDMKKDEKRRFYNRENARRRAPISKYAT